MVGGTCIREFNLNEIKISKSKLKSKSQYQYTDRQFFSYRDIMNIINKRKEGETHVVINGRRCEIFNTRLETFRKSNVCVECGTIGKIFGLEKGGSKNEVHLNLYRVHSKGKKTGQLSLMTQDHILPKSHGGSDDLSNLQTMCSRCNNNKGNRLDIYILRAMGVTRTKVRNEFIKAVMRKPLVEDMEAFVSEVTDDSNVFCLKKNIRNVDFSIDDIEVMEAKGMSDTVSLWSVK